VWSSVDGESVASGCVEELNTGAAAPRTVDGVGSRPVEEEEEVVGLLGALMCRRKGSLVDGRTSWRVPGRRAVDPRGSVVSVGRPVK
jgi:hypothetical protein